MEKILRILYLLFYFSVPKFVLNKLILHEQIETLKLVAEKGNYKNRIFIAKNIDSLSIEYQWKLIIILLNDKIEYISKNIINKYEFYYLPNELTILLLKRKSYWNAKKIADKERQKKISEMLKNTTQYKRKFSNGETLQNLKQMLRKPMNIGKWF